MSCGRTHATAPQATTSFDVRRQSAAEAARRLRARHWVPRTPPEVPLPFSEIRGSNRCAGLPHQHHPLSEFLTLSTV
jgi:hypothetical protein